MLNIQYGAFANPARGLAAGLPRIAPVREQLDRRHTDLSFSIDTGGRPYFRVLVARERSLFAPDQAGLRNASNFYDSRHEGLLPFDGPPCFYLVPRGVLHVMLPAPRLYYTLIAYDDPNGGGAAYAHAPETLPQEAPSVALEADLGRSLGRMFGTPVSSLLRVGGGLAWAEATEEEEAGEDVGAVVPHGLGLAADDEVVADEDDTRLGEAAAWDAGAQSEDTVEPARAFYAEADGYDDGYADPLGDDTLEGDADLPPPLPEEGRAAAYGADHDACAGWDAPHRAEAAPQALADDYDDGYGGFDTGMLPAQAQAVEEAGEDRYGAEHDVDGAQAQDAPRYNSPMPEMLPDEEADGGPAAQAGGHDEDEVELEAQAQAAEAVPAPRPVAFDIEACKAILARIMPFESGRDGFARVVEDGEFAGRFGTAHPAYQRYHLGLTFGAFPFVQEHGTLGQLLTLMRDRDRDRAAFDALFPSADELLAVTTGGEGPRAYIVARATLGLGRGEEARRHYDRLLAIPGLRVNGEIHWLALFDRGRIAEDERDDARALELYRQAVDVIEAQRATIHTEAAKIGFIGNRQEVYERLIQLLLRKREVSLALEYVERAKARALVDMLASRLTSPAAIAAPAASGAALSDFFAAEARSLLQPPVPTDAHRGGLQQVLDILRAASPQVASLLAVDAVPTPELQERLAPDETLLQFFIAGTQGSVFVVTRNTLRSYGFDAAGLDAAVRGFNAAIRQQAPGVTELGAALYRRLLGEALADVKTPNLLIVPHGALHYLSFAALHDGRGYLIDRFALRSLPSASVLRYLQPHADGAASMLVLGNPDLGAAGIDLPNAQREAEAIAGMGPNRVLLVREKATETAFLAEVAKYRYVHVATHGIFDAARPLDSALLLTADAKNDGHLTVSELYRLRLNADLVTLSACDTGLSGVASGDDLVGLTRGFFNGGASSVVASLWDIEDASTLLFMQRFYTQLAQGDKRQALRQAQLDTRRQYPHPFHWAAFYLAGLAR